MLISPSPLTVKSPVLVRVKEPAMSVLPFRSTPFVVSNTAISSPLETSIIVSSASLGKLLPEPIAIPVPPPTVSFSDGASINELYIHLTASADVSSVPAPAPPVDPKVLPSFKTLSPVLYPMSPISTLPLISIVGKEVLAPVALKIFAP